MVTYTPRHRYINENKQISKKNLPVTTVLPTRIIFRSDSLMISQSMIQQRMLIGSELVVSVSLTFALSHPCRHCCIISSACRILASWQKLKCCRIKGLCYKKKKSPLWSDLIPLSSRFKNIWLSCSRSWEEHSAARGREFIGGIMLIVYLLVVVLWIPTTL